MNNLSLCLQSAKGVVLSCMPCAHTSLDWVSQQSPLALTCAAVAGFVFGMAKYKYKK